MNLGGLRPLSLAVVAGAFGIASPLLPRLQPRMLIVPGLLVMAAGLLVLTRFDVDSGYLTSTLPAEILFGVGVGCAMSLRSASPRAQPGTARHSRHGTDERDCTMTTAPYLPPSWAARVIGNRMARIVARSVLRTLAVRGRKTGQWRKVPIVVLEHDNQRYLLAPRGNTDWSRNLRAAGSGRLTFKGRTEEFDAVDVPVAERPPLIEAYLEQFGRYPSVTDTFRQLPDPADHPTFRLIRSGPAR
ncbi:MAG TPA: nitroreductase family deazaflavin-dependent oxidoreductase [Actinomycetes bacterium]|jgi:deazaflavin-dependent oxidoreductase (nitroreductase family)|nr:nitroreductase family deazaflavin-dependent oxidoreductase [Actinomycetes bacterium]